MSAVVELRNRLAAERLVAIVRGRDADAAIAAGLALVEAGVTVLEVSLVTDDALRVIRAVAERAGAGCRVGAGTVLTRDDAHRSRDASADFVVTPALAPSIEAAAELGLPVLAGALTPSEIVEADARGAAAVKVFPVSAVGPDYLSAVREPLPGIGLVPVGGVDAPLAVRCLELGALAVGVGSPLLGDAPHGGSLAALRERAAAFRAALAPHRSGAPA